MTCLRQDGNSLRRQRIAAGIPPRTFSQSVPDYGVFPWVPADVAALRSTSPFCKSACRHKTGGTQKEKKREGGADAREGATYRPTADHMTPCTDRPRERGRKNQNSISPPPQGAGSQASSQFNARCCGCLQSRNDIEEIGYP